MPSEVSYDDRWVGAAPGATAGESSRRSPRGAMPAGSTPRSAAVGTRRAPSGGLTEEALDWDGPGPAAEPRGTGWTAEVGMDAHDRVGGVPGRRTVTITGHGEEAWHSRNGTRPSRAARHQHHLKRHERAGFRPDRVAMWAVLLGVMLMLAAAASSHAAVLVSHHAAALLRLH